MKRSITPKYIRDGRAPIPDDPKVSKVMSSIRAKNTGPEKILRKELRRIGLKDYRLHDKSLPGRPDIVFPTKKFAIFVNGCYWHRCPKCQKGLPKSHKSFWKAKFQKNVERDKKKIADLKKIGWQVQVFWECEVKAKGTKLAEKIKLKLEKLNGSGRKMSLNTLKVIELFAGVGGFRLGLESKRLKEKGINYETVWFNQWEPSTKAQHAWDIYVKKFYGEKDVLPKNSNCDISKVDVKDIPDHDILVGGFPCQDYSVARTLSHAAGIVGKKGVLWWEIYRILKEKGNRSPAYLMLENVDRLLKSPVKQRGRDFALMLSSLSELGYIVEWRVINAAEYGMPQRRRRIFILGYHKRTKIAQTIKGLKEPIDWIKDQGVIARAFPVDQGIKGFDKYFELDKDLVKITDDFKPGSNGESPFENTGIMLDRRVYTQHVVSAYDGPKKLLKDIILDDDQIPSEYFISQSDLPRWEYLKGPKNEPRRSKGDFIYNYSEGGMAFPDPLDRPSRTIITGEGGSAPSRFKHVVKVANGKLRRLTPIELERLNEFPDGHTAGMPDVRRAFMMGNALVVGVVERLGKELAELLGT